LSDVTEANALDEAQRRLAESHVRSARLAGVALSGDAKTRFNALQVELSALSSKFSDNILDATKAYSLTLTDPADVASLPASVQALMASNHEEEAAAASKGDDETKTPAWRVTLDPPVFEPFMQYCANRALRETVHTAYVTRASPASSTTTEHNNVATIEQMLKLRSERAALLGFESHAQLSMYTKMATLDAAKQVHANLFDASYAAAEAEFKDLQAYSTGDGVDGALPLGTALQPWDVPFFARQLKDERFSVNDELVRPYFPLDRVLSGLFALCKQLFCIEIEEAANSGAAEVWQNDVRLFDVWCVRHKGEKKLIGQFYFDPYSRPADKNGGAWMDVCYQRSDALSTLPVAYIVCNQRPPVGDTPSLMNFRELTTVAHELGHGLQHLLTTVGYSDVAGIAGVEWDAVELPSQFMENFCYHWPTVRALSAHHETGASLPRDLFDKLCAARTFMAGSATLRQLYFGSLDLALHDVQADGGNGNNGNSSSSSSSSWPLAMQHAMAKKFCIVPPSAQDHFLCGFSHIFAGGYSAGYFSYIWAEVMSADAFEAFEEEGALLEGGGDAAAAAVAAQRQLTETGMRFRDTVLAMGGARSPADVFRMFRGREPNVDGLLRAKGLSSSSAASSSASSSSSSSSSA
jgi:oligopeptidase A